jgi:hypothetical protein
MEKFRWKSPFFEEVPSSQQNIDDIDVGLGQYLLIPFLGDEHPFTSYFDVHQGYKVLTHCHIDVEFPLNLISIFIGKPWEFHI